MQPHGLPIFSIERNIMDKINDTKNLTSDRRVGDTVKISGDYQWRAANSPNPVQRFWHLTKKTAIDFLCPPAKDSLILDVGCGSGVIASYLSTKYSAKVIGLDGNIDAVNFAKATYPDVEFRSQLVDDDFGINLEVDSIYCLELIEHIYCPQAIKLLDNFQRLLKPGGKLFLTTPNYRSAWPIIEKAMDLFGVAPQLLEEQHVTFYNPESLQSLVRSRGFAIEAVRTNCFLAPWIAPLSLGAAKWLDSKEIKMRFPLGSIIVLVAKKV